MILSTIFIGGIHGAGKTQLGKQLSTRFNLNHVTASDLIRQAGVAPSDDQKQVNNIAQQQDLLVVGLQNYRATSDPILLDGHFCLIDKQSQQIKPIPLATFESIRPLAVVVVSENVAVIQERLALRNITYSIEFIEAFQAAEIEYAIQVCHKLNETPLLVSTPGSSIEEVVVFVQKYLNQSNRRGKL